MGRSLDAYFGYGIVLDENNRHWNNPEIDYDFENWLLELYGKNTNVYFDDVLSKSLLETKTKELKELDICEINIGYFCEEDDHAIIIKSTLVGGDWCSDINDLQKMADMEVETKKKLEEFCKLAKIPFVNYGWKVFGNYG